MKTPYPFECILLSGMPCTGKDTLSHQLVERDPAFAFFNGSDPRAAVDTFLSLL